MARGRAAAHSRASPLHRIDTGPGSGAAPVGAGLPANEGAALATIWMKEPFQ